MTGRDTAPVFVVGSARSGNTMLYHTLLSSGHFPVYRTEPVVFDLLVPRFGDFRDLSVRRSLMDCWLRSRQFRRSGVDAQEITEKVVSSVRSGGEFLCAVMNGMAKAGGFRRWAVWGPDNLLYMSIIKQQIPKAIFVHVIRDGRDVAYALDRRRFIQPSPWDRGRRLYVSGLHWMWKVRRGREDGKAIGADYMEVRFEDLVLNPQSALEKVGAFIGAELDYRKIRQAQIGALRNPNTSFQEELQAGQFSPVGRWRKRLPEREVVELEGLIGGLLTELDYDLSQPRRAIGARQRTMRAMYPAYYDWKEWLKMKTPLGRWVNTDRLRLDEKDDAAEPAGGFYENEAGKLAAFELNHRKIEVS